MLNSYNISIPLIEKAKIIEPYAAPIEERFKNFTTIDMFRNLNSCLYIKPFFNRENDLPKYISKINELNINNVCVGVKFNNKAYVPCVSLYEKEIATELFENQIEGLLDFIMKIRTLTKAKVYGSSVCFLNKNNTKKCDIKLYKYSKVLCKDCDLMGE